MNKRTTPILILVASLVSATAATFASEAPKGAPAVGFWASKVTVTSWNDLLDRSESNAIVAGTDRNSVLAELGRPAQELSPDVWIYGNCQPDQAAAQAK